MILDPKVRKVLEIIETVIKTIKTVAEEPKKTKRRNPAKIISNASKKEVKK